MLFSEQHIPVILFKAVADLGWSQPTLIQEKAIPLALEGKDLLARARTGSGKTAAYAVPVIQRILDSKQVRNELTSVNHPSVLMVISSSYYEHFFMLSIDMRCDVGLLTAQLFCVLFILLITSFVFGVFRVSVSRM